MSESLKKKLLCNRCFLEHFAKSLWLSFSQNDWTTASAFEKKTYGWPFLVTQYLNVRVSKSEPLLIKLVTNRAATLLKRDSGTGVSLWILQYFTKNFKRAPLKGYFWFLKSHIYICVYRKRLMLNYFSFIMSFFICYWFFLYMKVFSFTAKA